MLEARRLGKRFGSHWAFRNVEFELERGQCLTILGQNGSGKSTLLKTLAGLMSPSEGSVILPPGDLRTALGMSSLELAVYPSLSVVEHLRLSSNLRGCDARAEELLETVGLAKATNLLGSQLSTGMRSRLKIAMAIQAKPILLLLDEPGAGMDEAGTALIERVVVEQLGRGALVLATNDASERRFATLELRLAS